MLHYAHATYSSSKIESWLGKYVSFSSWGLIKDGEEIFATRDIVWAVSILHQLVFNPQHHRRSFDSRHCLLSFPSPSMFSSLLVLICFFTFCSSANYIYILWGITRSFADGIPSGHWYWNSGTNLCSVNVTSVKSWRSSPFPRKHVISLIFQVFFPSCQWCIPSGCCPFPIGEDCLSSPFQVSGQNSFAGRPAWSSTTLPCTPCIPICGQVCILGSQRHKLRCHGPNHHYHNRWCRSGFSSAFTPYIVNIFNFGTKWS